MKLDITAIRKLRDTLLAGGRRPTLVLSTAYETLARAGVLGPEEGAALQRIDPIAEALFLAVSADGRIADAERDAFRGAVRALTDDVVRSGTGTVMLEAYGKRLSAEGRPARLAAVADALAEHPDEAEATFALAAAVATADDQFAAEESSLVAELGERLGISPARRAEILGEFGL